MESGEMSDVSSSSSSPCKFNLTKTIETSRLRTWLDEAILSILTADGKPLSAKDIAYLLAPYYREYSLEEIINAIHAVLTKNENKRFFLFNSTNNDGLCRRSCTFAIQPSMEDELKRRIVKKYPTCPRILKPLLTLFKNKDAPIELLITTLVKLVNNQRITPTHFLTFPVFMSSQSPTSSPSLNAFALSGNECVPESIEWVYDYRQEAQSESLSTGWSDAALCLPIPTSKNISLFKNHKFSLSLWISVERPKTYIGYNNYRKTHPSYRNTKTTSSNQYFHIFSIVLDKTLLEVWLDHDHRMVIIRSIRISSGRPRIVAQVCSPCHLTFSGSWHHISFNFEELKSTQFDDAALLVHYIVDGSRMETVAVNHECPSFSAKKCILLGSLSASPSNSSSSSNIILRIGNMIIFKRELTIKHCLYLFSMGPDFATFRVSLIPELESKLETIRISKHLSWSKFLLDSFLNLSPSACFHDLQESIFIIFKPSSINYSLIYTPVPSDSSLIPFTARSNSINQISLSPPMQVNRSIVLTFTELRCNTDTSLNKVLVETGGIGVLIFFFAKMVEITYNEDVQAKALEILLKMCEAHYEFFLSFCFEFNGFKLINSVIETPDCSVSKKIFDRYLSFSVSDLNTKNAVIIDSSSFSYLIAAWRAWIRKAETTNCFITVLVELISENNIHKKFNLVQMRKAHIADILLTMLKDSLVQVENSSHQLPFEVAKNLPLIISLLVCYNSSLDLSILNDVFDTLLLLHQASNTFVCHSKASFYYLFPSKWKSFTLNFRIKKLSNLNSSCISQVTENQNTSANEWQIISLTNAADESSHPTAILYAANNEHHTPDATLNTLHEPLQNGSHPPSQPSNVNDTNTIINDANDTQNDDDVSKFYTHILNTVISGFFNVIVDIISGAPTQMLDKIIGAIIKPGFLVVMTHNDDNTFRESVLKCLLLCIKRGRNTEAINQFLAKHGLHLMANQLHHHPATANLIRMTYAHIFNLDILRHNQSIEEFFLFDSSFNFTEVYKLSVDHFNSFVLLFALLPNSVGDPNLCHTTLSVLRRFFEEMPSSNILKHLYEIGLVECLTKVLIFAEKIKEAQTTDTDNDGYEEDVITNDVCKILYILGKTLYDSSGSTLWTMYAQIFGLLQTLEKRSIGPIKTCMREALTVFLESALDCSGNHLAEYLKPRDDKSRFGRALNKSEKFLSLFSSPDESYMLSNSIGYRPEFSSLSTYSSFRSIVDSVSDGDSYKENRIQLTSTEVNDRFKRFIIRAVDFLLMKDKELPFSEREKFFSRALIHRLFQILDLSHKGSSAKWRKPILNNFIGSCKEAVKNELYRLILYLISPIQTLNERQYYVSFFRGNLENLLILLRSSARFARYFVSFLKDLAQTGGESDAQRIIQELLNFNASRNASFRRANDSESIKQEICEWFTEWDKERNSLLSTYQEEQFLERLKPLSQKTVEAAMSITREAVEAQNQERKMFINHLKHLSSERYSIHKNWKSIIEMFSHEKSVWHYPDSYPQSWELDPVEGPMRIRRRLRRCHLNIPEKFFCNKHKRNGKVATRNLNYLFQRNIYESDINDLIDRLYTNERILYTTSCLVIVPADEYPGEILIGSSCIHFVGEQKCLFSESSVFTEVWLFEEIKEIHQCRYQLQNKAFEMFLANGSSYLISFENKAICDEFLKILYMRTLSNLTQKKSLDSVTASWKDGQLTNFEYLTFLNKMAGRSFNDLMQYPVFPFILADFESDILNLKSANTYRILSKPMGIQKKAKEEYYINQYNYLKEEYKRTPRLADNFFPTTGPYHYGSHYSNSGTVLQFLVRLPPFTQMFLTYQDNNFDIPDRMFHSIATTWRLASGESSTDFKELIPEFFYLPEFLVNLENFNFGVRQNGEVVDNVRLPLWCRGDPRLFILIHRQSLESDYVTQNIHEWIDLVFGYKQTGKAAVEAINTFHPATYFGVDVSKIEDSVRRKALHTMIKTFGQMPKQLFNHPHSASNLSKKSYFTANETAQEVLREVIGLKWGSFLGSPTEPDPVVVFREKCSKKINSFATLLTNDIFSLEPCTCLLLTYNRPKSISSNSSNLAHITSSALVSWDHPDNVIRIRFNKSGPSLPLLSCNSSLDKIKVCATSSGRPSLLIGYQSGLIVAYNFADPFKEKATLRGCKSWLHGHRGAISSIVINQEFNVIISGSQDGACILWDLNRLFYVRTIVEHPNTVKLITISSTLGDIATVSDHEGISYLKVYTINGSKIGEVSSKDQITALCYSSCKEGISVNTLVLGYSDGSIRMLSSWDLSYIRTLQVLNYVLPIKCLAYTHDNQFLHAANEEGTVIIWGKVNSKKTTHTIHLFMQETST